MIHQALQRLSPERVNIGNLAISARLLLAAILEIDACDTLDFDQADTPVGARKG